MAIPNQNIMNDLMGRDLWKQVEKNRPKMRELVKKDLGLIQPATIAASSYIETDSFVFEHEEIHSGDLEGTLDPGYRENKLSKAEKKKAKDLSKLRKSKREIIF